MVVPDQAAMFASLRQQHPDIQYFFKADTHWTALGAEQSAKLMASELKAHPPSAGSLPPQPSNSPRRRTRCRERNDLSSLLPSAQQAAYPFQHYMVRKPVAAGGSGLLDDDTADVLVIGNSYMQPAYGYASVPIRAAWAPRLALLEGPISRASISPCWPTYKSDSFKKQRPKLVVWNMAEDDFEVTSNNPGAWGQTAMPPTAFLADMKQALTV